MHPDPNPWLEEKVRDEKVKMYSDRDIVSELSKVYGVAATSMYLTLLESSCEIFNAGFFEKYYGPMKNMDNLKEEAFFLALKECDDRVPHKNGLGEKKTYVLIQMTLKLDRV